MLRQETDIKLNKKTTESEQLQKKVEELEKQNKELEEKVKQERNEYKPLLSFYVVTWFLNFQLQKVFFTFR